MEKEKWGVHEGHCCVIHGCKYGDEDCPVLLRKTKQDYTCESCGYDGFKEVDEIIEFLHLKDEVKMKNDATYEKMTVSVDVLHRILSRI